MRLLWFLNLLYLRVVLHLLMPFYVMEVLLTLTSLQLVGRDLTMGPGLLMDYLPVLIPTTLRIPMDVLPLLILRLLNLQLLLLLR